MNIIKKIKQISYNYLTNKFYSMHTLSNIASSTHTRNLTLIHTALLPCTKSFITLTKV